MSTPSERTWIVDRKVVEDPDTGDVHDLGIDADELEQTVIDVATVVRMIGGVCTFGARRKELPSGEYITTRIVFSWKSFVPSAPRPRTPAPTAEPAPAAPVEEPAAEPDQEAAEEPAAA